MPSNFRRPLSVLIVVYTDDARVLLLRRGKPFDFWQSVTGSLKDDENHATAARRELFEETGLRNEGELEFTGISRQFAIDSRWRNRFAPGVVENVEFEYHYRVAEAMDIRVDDTEHTEYRWLPLEEAIDTVWSWTNRDALWNLQRP